MPCPPLLPPSWQLGHETLQLAWLQPAVLQPLPCPLAAHSHSVLHANQLADRPALPVDHSRQVQQIGRHPGLDYTPQEGLPMAGKSVIIVAMIVVK